MSQTTPVAMIQIMCLRGELLRLLPNNFNRFSPGETVARIEAIRCRLREIEFVRAAYPSDPDMLYISADSWLSLGRPATARREFTIALTGRTDFAAAYLGRAMAAARWGDASRTRADLEIAAKLDASATKKIRSSIENELKKQQVDGSPDHPLTALEQAAQADAPLDQLVSLAVKVHKATGVQRLRYDETYQDKLRTLEDTVRARPKNPDNLANLAEYILAESDRGESVEPRRELLYYRWQESKEKERLRAVEILDRALALNPKHVKAMIQKAIALSMLKRYDELDNLRIRHWSCQVMILMRCVSMQTFVP